MSQVPRDRLVRLDLKDHRALQVPLVLRVHKERQELRVQRDQQGLRAKPVHKAYKALRGLPGQQVQQVRVVILALKVLLVLQGHRVFRGFKDLLV